jgi:diaminopropionate ammonia-lyase
MTTRLPIHPLRCFVNPRADRAAPYGAELQAILSLEAGQAARAEIGSWPDYAPTPLRRLDGLARAAGIGALWYKDEAGRFGLGSFKALGGAYAVLRLIQARIEERMGRAPAALELNSGAMRYLTRGIPVTCATDGNHGRSVAWGARLFGCPCVIYLHEHVSAGREAAIAAYGAEIVRVPGTYDDAVRAAARDAEAQGRIVVSDTSYPGYMEVPRIVMQGYSVLIAEALEQLPPDAAPTHVFVQGGVGGLAAAVLAHLWEAWGAERPRLAVVEPERADCLYQSARAGHPARSTGDLNTIMAGLSCGEVSPLAWEILGRGADAFLTIPDDAAADTMRLLADGAGGDAPIVAGESAVAGLAGLLCALPDAAARAALELDAASRVLVIGSEGATDPALYAQIVGRTPGQVAGG